MAIVEEYDIATGSEVERSLRQVITKWANEIPFHPHKNFGEKINIDSITYSPIYLLNCLTQFYSVGDTPKERSYGNGFTYNSKDSFVPHNYKRESFEKHVERYCVPGSETVHDCTKCHGRGKISCNNCSGRGTVNCHSCGGSGNCSQCKGSGRNRCSSCSGGRQTCSSCGGTRGRYQYDSISRINTFVNCTWCGGSGTQRCNTCGGSGNTTCWGCMGSGHCNVCNGSKTLRCNTCSGTGEITCYKCDGDGKFIAYTERAEKWDFCNKSRYVLSPTMSEDFENIPIKKNTTIEFISDEYAEILDEDLYDSEAEHFQYVYQNLLQSASVPGSLDVGSDAKILEQYTSVNRIPVHYVLYNFEGNDYGLIVFPKDEDVFEENGPITLFRKELIQNAHRALKRKNYGKSAEYAEQAVKMGLDTRDPLLEKIHKKVGLKIKANYKIGAFFGALFTAYFVSLGILSHLTSPKYFLNNLNEKVSGWGSNFLFINNIILVLLILIISVTKSVKLAGNKMAPFPGREIKPEAMRFATGFVTGIFYTLFVAVVFLFINYTGVLLLLTKLIYFLVHLIFPNVIP